MVQKLRGERLAAAHPLRGVLQASGQKMELAETKAVVADVEKNEILDQKLRSCWLRTYGNKGHRRRR